jgi:hypothetical protein
MNLTTATVIAVIGTVSVAHAQDRLYSANNLLPACRTPSTSSQVSQGVCLGMIAILIETGRPASGLQITDPVRRFCTPPEVSLGQAKQVAVSHIEARPARWHEDFPWLALEAFRAAWPCR